MQSARIARNAARPVPPTVDLLVSRSPRRKLGWRMPCDSFPAEISEKNLLQGHPVRASDFGGARYLADGDLARRLRHHACGADVKGRCNTRRGLIRSESGAFLPKLLVSPKRHVRAPLKAVTRDSSRVHYAEPSLRTGASDWLRRKRRASLNGYEPNNQHRLHRRLLRPSSGRCRR